jgi:hypothetical protein
VRSKELAAERLAAAARGEAYASMRALLAESIEKLWP